MRIDLTPAFLAEMSKDGNEPIQLLVFHFDPLTLGDIFVADRDIVIGGQLYEGLVENWGDLSTVGAENAVSSTMTMTVTLWNGGGSNNLPFSSFFFNEDPVNVFVEVFQTYAGLDPEDMAHIGEFTIQDPIEYDEASSLLYIELVTTNMRYFAQVGKLLTTKEHPEALESDVNKPINLIVGNAGRVKCICNKKPPITTIDRSVVRNTTTIEVNDNIYDKGFPLSGFFTLNGENIFYPSHTDFAFTNCKRGNNGTQRTDHGVNSQVIEATTVQYIVGLYPLSSVNEIWVGGRPTIQSYRIVDNVVGATVIEFDEQPVYEVIAPAKENTVFFDTTIAGSVPNSFHSYSDNYRAEGALLEWSLNFKKLHIANLKDSITENGVGEIVNIFLNLRHWETNSYAGKSVFIRMKFQGAWHDVDWLTVPNPNAVLNLVADVDIDHPHLHETGGEHAHVNVDPVFSADSGVHDHVVKVDDDNGTGFIEGDVFDTVAADGLTVTGKKIVKFHSFKVPQGQVIYSLDVTFNTTFGTFYQGLTTITFSRVYIGNEFRDSGSVESGTYNSVRASVGDFEKYATYDGFDYYRFPMEVFLYCGSSSALDLYCTGSLRFGITRIDYKWTRSAATDIESAKVDTTINQDNVGEVGNIQGAVVPIKDEDDVGELLTGNRTVDVKASDSSLYTQEYTDVFDLLDVKPGLTWEDLQGCELECLMQNDADGVGIYVTWCDLTVEFKQPEFKATDDISCVPVGSIDNRPDNVIWHLLHNIAGVPAENFGSVWRDVPIWLNTDIWLNTNIWSSGGNIAPGFENEPFAEAAAWFAQNNYLVDGVLLGNISVKEAIKELTWQTRSRIIWQNSKVQLVIKRKTADWIIAKEMALSDIQLKSYKAKRSRVDQIQNHIDLFHTIDRLSEAAESGMYDKSVSETDDESILKHGEKKDDSMWLFDLVRIEAMATNIADYYIWELGETSTYYQFDAYLNNYNVEKEDYIRINSFRFDRLLGVPAVVRECVRRFGSGKLNKINTLQFIAQVIRHKLLLVEVTDKVMVNDPLTIDFGFDVTHEDIVAAGDLLLIAWAREQIDTIGTSDNLSILAEFRPEIVDQTAVTDVLTSHMDVTIEDSVLVYNALNIHDRKCYNTCGYGEIPYGSPGDLFGANDEFSQIQDILTIAWAREFSDSVEISDKLILSDGYGCPKLGDGYGVTPYGDPNC